MYEFTLVELRERALELLTENNISFYKLAVHSDLIDLARGTSVVRETKATIMEVIERFDYYLAQAKSRLVMRQTVPVHPQLTKLRSQVKGVFTKPVRAIGVACFVEDYGLAKDGVYRALEPNKRITLDWFIMSNPGILNPQLTLGGRVYALNQPGNLELAKRKLMQVIISKALKEKRFRLTRRVILLPEGNRWIHNTDITENLPSKKSIKLDFLVNIALWLGIKVEFTF